MRSAFADTFYWVALLNADDAAHAKVIAFDGAKDRPHLLTTDEVLIEFLTFFSRKGSLFRVKAVAIARSLQHNRGVHVLPQAHASYLAGLDFYAKRYDKGYCLTDCISMEIMRREGLTDVLTNDRHFEKEGFTLSSARFRFLGVWSVQICVSLAGLRRDFDLSAHQFHPLRGCRRRQFQAGHPRPKSV